MGEWGVKQFNTECYVKGREGSLDFTLDNLGKHILTFSPGNLEKIISLHPKTELFFIKPEKTNIFLIT